MHLDERLEAVAQGVKAVNESLEPLLQSSKTPTATRTQYAEDGEDYAILRKHATMLAEWDAVQKESQVLREELKEDKWLTVFRTVTEQADGMMSSLEKAINRCQVSNDVDLLTFGDLIMFILCRTSYSRFINVARTTPYPEEHPSALFVPTSPL